MMYLFKIGLIASFLFSFQNLYSQSATIDRPNNSIPYEFKSIKEQVAYQNKVGFKLMDFYNYLEIISNPKIEKQLRQHTLELARKLFSRDIITIDFLLGSNEEVLLSSLLNNLLNSKEKFHFSLLNVNTLPADSFGNVTYNLVVKRGSERIGSHALNQSFDVNIMAKKFGSNIKNVSVIRLGEISD